MPDFPSRRRTDVVTRRIRAERDRALRAAAVAAWHETLATVEASPTLELHKRMATIHRGIERRHLVSAGLYDQILAKSQAPSADSAGDARGPSLLSEAAEFAGSTGAIIALAGSHRAEAMCVVSDAVARQVHDIELKLSQGPSCDAMRTRRTVTAEGKELARRWCLFGVEAAALGVRSVAATPMIRGTACLGALTLLNPVLSAGECPSLDVLGDVVTQAVLDGYLIQAGLAQGLAAGQPRAVYQATGVVSVRCHCSVNDAWAMIRAGAFADGVGIDDVARRILQDRESGF